ncbi:DNA helicase [Enterobacteria phage vB_EcoM_IME339]|uniref:DNA helicase n=1 Tax=Enterobacteria phage vB_EcoM_IME339 TaxID=2163889 RepID=A0A2S1GQ53_9CAUD|nr:DNA helicase [Enterobacteria phage vB_EcoM_IME339]AWD91499.1 DNA helicase [Enterobacteria phage vB_EcoM_IME339]
MLLEFKQFLYEASIDEFMGKIASCQTLEGLEELEAYYKKRVKDCQTLEGLEELEAYYKKRVKETELKDTDDISVRDALAGKRAELEDSDDEVEESF